MEKNMNPTQEELKAMVEKAQREYEEMLAKMTPEEREQAILRGQQAVAEDQAAMQRMIEDANRVAAGAPIESIIPKCPNCGAPAGDGKFCGNCGSALK